MRFTRIFNFISDGFSTLISFFFWGHRYLLNYIKISFISQKIIYSLPTLQSWTISLTYSFHTLHEEDPVPGLCLALVNSKWKWIYSNSEQCDVAVMVTCSRKPRSVLHIVATVIMFLVVRTPNIITCNTQLNITLLETKGCVYSSIG